uniref:Domain of unknown function DB domain-containing protein n=1 Tax=Setaria digitata TaxID=48799 RepID=A0A915PP24_9BILA
MDVTLAFLSVAISIFVGNTGADLPSCERARCHHCRVTFIARMCPETCGPCSKENTPKRYQSKFVNDSSNIFQRSQRPQAKTVTTQQLSPQHLLQNPLYGLKYDLISPLSTQISSYQHQFLPQQSQSGIQLPPIRQLSLLPLLASSAPNQQTDLVDTALSTFTLPTLPPFPFPTVTFASPIYRGAVAEISPHQLAPVPAAQTELEFFQPQRQRAELFTSEQTVAPYGVIGAHRHSHTYPQAVPYRSQQQSYSLRQPGQLQQHTPYSQQQHSFYASQQQSARPFAQAQLAEKIATPALQSAQIPVAYSIDVPPKYIEEAYYKTSQKRPTAIAQIQLAVLTGRCPLSKVGNVMICASGYQDATSCCEAHNVFELGYEHCRPYCNPAAGLPQGVLLSEQYKCLGKLSQIQRCFYVSQRP